MRRHLQRNAIAYLALFVALGGTSYAAVKLPRNSVGTAQLKANAVTSGKVRNGSLKLADFGKGQAPAGATGAAGPKGDAGAAGPAGATGPAGPPSGAATGALFGAAAPTVAEGFLEKVAPITVPQPSKVFLFGRGTYDVSCSSGTAKIGLALYDANSALIVIAEASGATLNSGVSADLSLFGVTATVPAGSYRPAIVYQCPTGNFTGSGASGSGALGAIVLGG